MDVELSPTTRDALESYNLSPLWEIEEEHLGTERADLEPDVWKWEHVQETIDRIEADVQIDELPPGFRRRVAVPVNPTYPAAISHTIYVGIQTVSPGETAPSHRHGANALRFAIDGNPDVKTVVGGEEFPMRDNDLITTPQWEWHDHVNESDDSAAWLDVLDLPLVFNSLNVGNVFEDHDDERQPVDKPMGYHESQFGKVRRRATTADIPGPFEGTHEPTPPFRFGWADVAESLEYAAEAGAGARDPVDGIALEYVNPATGREPLFPTFGVRAQRLPGGADLDAHRHNTVEIFYVVAGSGETAVGDRRLEWGERDLFVIPPNHTHAHNPDGDATLLAIHDRPLLEGINLYYETAG